MGPRDGISPDAERSWVVTPATRDPSRRRQGGQGRRGGDTRHGKGRRERRGGMKDMKDMKTHPNATTTPPFSSTTDFLHPGQYLSSVSSVCVGGVSSVMYSAMGAGWGGGMAASIEWEQLGRRGSVKGRPGSEAYE